MIHQSRQNEKDTRGLAQSPKLPRPRVQGDGCVWVWAFSGAGKDMDRCFGSHDIDRGDKSSAIITDAQKIC